MTLCVAWKYEDETGSKIHFASDSCAVADPHVMPYGGVKVLDVPVVIRSATDAGTGQSSVILSKKYGMAFTGHYLAAFLLKELISEVLANAQFAGAADGVTFEHICRFVSRVHSHFYRQIRDHLTTNHQLSFFLGGLCPQSRRIRVAKFTVDPVTCEPNCQEILSGPGFSFETIGVQDGQDRFRKLMDLSLSAPCRTHFAAFRRLWDVIRDPEVRWVKGAVQYGDFEGEEFNLVGAFEVRVEEGRLVSKTFVRGTDVEEINKGVGLNDLHLQYSFGNPFDDDIRSFDCTRTFWELSGARHAVDEQVTVFPHDQKWSQWFGEEEAFLRMAGIDDGTTIEHFGSTAVPGLAAVPCVDMLVGADVDADVQVQRFNLTHHGYEYLGDKLIPGERCYRKRGPRLFNLCITSKGGDFWRKAIGLRDYLRQHTDECGKYSREKMRILNRGSWTLVRYLNERSNYLNELMVRAGL